MIYLIVVLVVLAVLVVVVSLVLEFVGDVLLMYHIYLGVVFMEGDGVCAVCLIPAWESGFRFTGCFGGALSSGVDASPPTVVKRRFKRGNTYQQIICLTTIE